MGHTPAHIFKKRFSGSLPFFRQKVVHIRRQPMNVFHAKILAVLLDVPVRRHIIKMFGSGYLGGKLPGQIKAGCFQQLNEPVKLAGRDKGIYRMRKYEQIGFRYRLCSK
ncbi:hypothetical protein [Thermoclostridium caenicola]|uniref:hypothetical protein n=1 Tax=Thermoclostridium caenicola TaxID=659425 RepID=UPI001FAA7741|nr:hypothetical protein [Thermoclostridium caenicola]